ncbi:MAG: formate dehydrogenase subunit gamma, partial [Actinobacteria bacterium]|nr:formate dehydrogenase subunit gamma [Actinomycetota bacterium]
MKQTIGALLIALFSMTVGLSHANETTRESTGGAQTLQDILARQAGQKID